MASYPTTIYVGTSVSGTTTVAAADHANMHNNVQDEINAVETTLGTTAGTSVLKNFAAGNFPARINASNVLQQRVSGTIDNAVIGTPTMAAGSWGTPTFTLGSDAQGDFIYRSAGGTLTRLGIGSNGQVITTNGTTPSWGTIAQTTVGMYVNAAAGSGTTASASQTDIAGGSISVPITATSDVFVSITGIENDTGNSQTHAFSVIRGAGTVIAPLGHTFFTAGNPVVFGASQIEKSVAAGTYTYKVQHSTSGGTITSSQVFINVIVKT